MQPNNVFFQHASLFHLCLPSCSRLSAEKKKHPKVGYFKAEPKLTLMFVTYKRISLVLFSTKGRHFCCIYFYAVQQEPLFSRGCEVLISPDSVLFEGGGECS